MTFKNKLGWFLLFMFCIINFYYAIMNYFWASKAHDANIGCINTGKQDTGTVWDHMPGLTHWHFGITIVAALIIFAVIVVYLIEDSSESLAKATLESE